MSLNCDPNLSDTDAIYQKLIATLEQQGSDEAAMRACARLILLLINHIGDKAIIEEAIEHAGLCREKTQ